MNVKRFDELVSTDKNLPRFLQGKRWKVSQLIMTTSGVSGNIGRMIVGI